MTAFDMENARVSLPIMMKISSSRRTASDAAHGQHCRVHWTWQLLATTTAAMSQDRPHKPPRTPPADPAASASAKAIQAAISPGTDAKIPALPQSEEKPPRYKARIPTAPSIRQLYWCDFPQDGHLPEFWKTRPVLVVSYKNVLSGAVTVVPCSSQEQPGNRWAFKLTTTIDGQDSWAICDKPTTVAVSRLSPAKVGVKRLSEAEFDEVLKLLFQWLPKLKPPASSDK